jgi:hypothetical protein
MGGLLLQLILRITMVLIKRSTIKSVRLQELMTEKDGFTFQIRTSAGWGGHFKLSEGILIFSSEIIPDPNFEQIWNNGFSAVKTMLSKDETDLLRAFEDGHYHMNGDFTIALWFNEVVKLSKP